ncbi:isoleucyl-tRNA synthetase [Encephalitozoon intestinalis ATCC 50506]|uniref:Probable isoleucine--tRNA ligase, cytoplasmic n=1 Tax=Encephalitozoon intestinalis (strain ATCC 50506) TaxID=876142 RepID=E0S9X6_ENCIT|nr:isoleucyl-tRNA synthetase [Encephalitozoon intestinalis ATCC 50506]ADM12598.1 isoleucyl-tRNA synthetase [Encephalitozoon intestinalis ATCC 50506]UTX46455.1 isoleucine-tRNA synthetase [Encephalitozoon intestinalis]
MYKKNANFVECEEEVLEYWKSRRCFERACEMSKGRKKFTFYDGPPFATGLPHYGHILSGTIKDTVTRFFYQQGYDVDRRFGWDCHGLPVEYEIDKKLGISSRDEVLKMGIDKYNKECRGIVMKYSSEWEKVVERLGRWISFENGYKTMDKTFMESVWNIFKELFNRGLVYRGFRVMPFSTACSTPLSNFESNQNYKDVSDPSVLIAFPLLKPFEGYKLSLVAWTTTPWTLPSNCALVVNPEFSYGIFEEKQKFYLMHVNRVEEYFKDAKILKRISGSELEGLEYEQPFPYFEEYRKKGFFRVYGSGFVTDTDGTGIVHSAPGFGESDYNVFVEKGLIRENDLVPCPVDENGRYTSEVKDYAGKYVKDCDKAILLDIKDKVLLNQRIVHKYPFCWRSDTPLLYKLVPNWFVRVKDHVDSLLRNNEEINWVPPDIKYKRFHNWLENARDWSVSRNRFWGTPIPLWTTLDYKDVICVGSVEELERLSGRKIDDIHREFIDDIVIHKDGKEYRRVEEVLDCWFESGSMPYAQDHWPFKERLEAGLKNLSVEEGKEGKLVKENFPADFIGEGVDQTRGWFYTLHVVSSLLFGQPAFLNVIVNGIVLAEDGRKMSKRLKNYPDPSVIFNTYGADSLRMYLISSPVVEAENLKFNENGVKEVLKTLIIPWYNSLGFYLENRHLEPRGERLLMDDWIRTTFDNFTVSLTDKMKRYELSSVLSLALRFVDDLSNWYIRMHRKEIRAGHHTVLGDTLRKFSIVMAPFTPFFSEYSYQSINPGESVHFQQYPVCKSGIHPFETAKSIITAVRRLREMNSISLKTPLKSATLISSTELYQKIRDYMDLIKSECNVLELLHKEEGKSMFDITVKPNFQNLKKNKDTMKRKMELIRKLTSDEAYVLLSSSLNMEGLEILQDDVLIVKKIKHAEGISQEFGDFSIAIDNTLNEDIVEMKVAREFHSYVQKLRKSMGLSISDDVVVDVECSDLKSIVGKHFDISFGNLGVLCGKGEYEFDGTLYSVSLYKKA